VITAGDKFIVPEIDPSSPLRSFAIIVKKKKPPAVGMPEIAPVDSLNDKPAGNGKYNDDRKVYGATPPEA
jgi:hypothetical protein